MSIGIDCYVIFNKATDREDWLDRCVASLDHPDVNVVVKRYSDTSHSRYRRNSILKSHDQRRWAFFADPDDVAVQPGYSRFIEHLLTTDDNVAAPDELVVYSNGHSVIMPGPHHMVALRGQWCSIFEDEPKLSFNGLRGRREIIRYPHVTYQWNIHPAQTGGGVL